MKKTYRIYCEEHPKETVSWSHFCKVRPFWIVLSKIGEREACACKRHENLQYMANALYISKVIQTTDIDDIAAEMCCSTTTKDCMYRECKQCKIKTFQTNRYSQTDTVSWYQWQTVKLSYVKSGEANTTTRVAKVRHEDNLGNLVKTFANDMNNSLEHLYNIHHQYSVLRKMKESLEPNEVVINMDWSENYVCKCTREIQSMHFGASHQQVSLHTGVIYKADSSVTAFCSMSDSIRHDPPAVWSHLHPVLMDIKEDPAIDTIHFISDGPTTQYRSKVNFAAISTKFVEYGFSNVTWNFHEAGHGKGAADGVGGAIKQAADRLVVNQIDITNADDLYNSLSNNDSTVKKYVIKANSVDEMEVTFPLKSKIPTYSGTMKVHQICTNTSMIGAGYLRHVSCFCKRPAICKCYKAKFFRFVPYVNTQCAERDVGVGEIDGAVIGVGELADAVIGVGEIDGAMIGVGELADAVIGFDVMDGSSIGVGEIDGAVIGVGELADAVIGVGEIAGAVIGFDVMDGSSIGVGEIDGAVIGVGKLADAVIGVGEIAGAVIGFDVMDGSSIGVGEIDGAVIGFDVMDGSSIGVGEIDGAMIGVGELADAVIGVGEIAGAVIGFDVMDGSSIGVGKLADAVIGVGKLADAVIGVGEIAGAVIGFDVMDGSSIGVGEIDGAVIGFDVMDGSSIGVGEIDGAMIGVGELADAVIGVGEIDGTMIGVGELADAVIGVGEIDGAVIGVGEIADAVIGVGEIADAVIGVGEIDGAVIGVGEIADAVIGVGELADAVIGVGEIADAVIGVGEIDGALIGVGEIADAVIGVGELADAVIGVGEIADAVIGVGEIDGAVIGVGEIADAVIGVGEIDGAVIGVGEMDVSKWCMVEYDTVYPGIILEVDLDENEVYVNTMTSSSSGYFWPKRKDTLWYDKKSYRGFINEPVHVSGKYYKLCD